MKHWFELTTAASALIVAIFSAGFTWWQASIARDAEQRQLRAYLYVTGEPIVFKPLETARIQIAISDSRANTGLQCSSYRLGRHLWH
jgi:hypothetical protein